MGRFAFVRLGLLLVALPLSAIGAPNSCPSGWFNYKKSCYKIFMQPKTWNDAEKFCRAQKTGCHLASIHDAAEFNTLAWYLYWYLIFKNIWIGLKDPKKQRVWSWSNGSSIGYTRWGHGELNSVWRDEKCAELRSWLWHVSWNIRDCNLLRPFLCKYRL